jgi:hypothetical protein
MLKNKVVFGIAIGAAAGFLVYQLATSEQTPQAKAPVSTSTINAPVSKPSPNTAEQASLASQAPIPPTANSKTANHESHAVPIPPEGASRDSSAKYSQSRPHGHENMNHRDERGRMPPGEPKKENSPKATPPNAPAS